jgi:hypothetical protein
VAAVGLALPVLSRVAVNTALSYGGDPADIESAVLAGFLVELHRTDVSVPGILGRLRAAAHRSGTVVRDTLTPATPTVSRPVSQPAARAVAQTAQTPPQASPRTPSEASGQPSPGADKGRP